MQSCGCLSATAIAAAAALCQDIAHTHTLRDGKRMKPEEGKVRALQLSIEGQRREKSTFGL